MRVCSAENSLPMNTKPVGRAAARARTVVSVNVITASPVAASGGEPGAGGRCARQGEPDAWKPESALETLRGRADGAQGGKVSSVEERSVIPAPATHAEIPVDSAARSRVAFRLLTPLQVAMEGVYSCMRTDIQGQ